MKYLLISVLTIIILASGFIFFRNRDSVSTPVENETPTVSSSATDNNELVFPIAEFKERITKKPFGLYVNPENSPVQPEKFTGYHTAVDIEYEDMENDVPVFAVNNGTVELSRTASGYGGVILIKSPIDGVSHSIIYGHLRPSSMVKVGTEVKKGEQIGLLGTGFSSETDNERRHLHFGILSDDRIDIRGYVQNQNELSGWIDPTSILN